MPLGVAVTAPNAPQARQPAGVRKLTGNRCQCPSCGEVFNRVSTFDRHRVGDFGADRRCLSVEQMQAKGWRTNAAGFWVTASGNWRPA